MIFGNYVVIMIMLMYIYVYMYVHMSFPNKVVKDHDWFILMFICIYVCMLLYDMIIRDNDCGGMIAYAGE